MTGQVCTSLHSKCNLIGVANIQAVVSLGNIVALFLFYLIRTVHHYYTISTEQSISNCLIIA